MARPETGATVTTGGAAIGLLKQFKQTRLLMPRSMPIPVSTTVKRTSSEVPSSSDDGSAQSDVTTLP